MSAPATFINPETKRPIRVGGPTHRQLEQKYANSPAKLAQIRRLAESRASPRRRSSSARKPSRTMSKAQLAHLQSLVPKAKVEKWHSVTPVIMKRHGTNVVDRRGMATRGWSKGKPQKKSEREAVMKRHGADCFLLPDQLKFPICAKNFPKSKTPPVSCQGIASANIRAAQHNYKDVQKTAKQLYKTLKCDQPLPPSLLEFHE